jgi:hypothetical protein
VTALVLGVIGTVLVASAQSGGRSSGMGVGIMVVSTLISAGYVLATKRFANGHEPVALVARQGIASLVVTAPFILGASLNGGSRLGTASLGCILLACLTGVIGFSIPYTLWTTSLPHVRAGFAAVALNLVPLVGVISATLLGQGGLSPGQWAGGGLILIGLVLLTRAEIAASEPATEPVAVPALPVPALPVPAQRVSTRPIPTQPIPTQPVLPQRIPARPIPGQPVPAQRVPAQPIWAPPIPALSPIIPAQRRSLGSVPRGEERRLRPGRTGQPVPTSRQRAAARAVG